MNENLITINNISKIYDNKTKALDHLSLSIKKGSWTSIMGPSGSGKTTLLNIIGCLDSPSHGKVTISDREVTSFNQKELLKKRRLLASNPPTILVLMMYLQFLMIDSFFVFTIPMIFSYIHTG